MALDGHTTVVTRVRAEDDVSTRERPYVATGTYLDPELRRDRSTDDEPGRSSRSHQACSPYGGGRREEVSPSQRVPSSCWAWAPSSRRGTPSTTSPAALPRACCAVALLLCGAATFLCCSRVVPARGGRGGRKIGRRSQQAPIAANPPPGPLQEPLPASDRRPSRSSRSRILTPQSPWSARRRGPSSRSSLLPTRSRRLSSDAPTDGAAQASVAALQREGVGAVSL